MSRYILALIITAAVAIVFIPAAAWVLRKLDGSGDKPRKPLRRAWAALAAKTSWFSQPRPARETWARPRRAWLVVRRGLPRAIASIPGRALRKRLPAPAGAGQAGDPAHQPRTRRPSLAWTLRHQWLVAPLWLHDLKMRQWARCEVWQAQRDEQRRAV